MNIIEAYSSLRPFLSSFIQSSHRQTFKSFSVKFYTKTNVNVETPECISTPSPHPPSYSTALQAASQHTRTSCVPSRFRQPSPNNTNFPPFPHVSLQPAQRLQSTHRLYVQANQTLPPVARVPATLPA